MTDELKAALQKAADDVAADARVLADARIATLIMAKTSGMPAGQTLDRVEAEELFYARLCEKLCKTKSIA
jgi:hypothetical protein